MERAPGRPGGERLGEERKREHVVDRPCVAGDEDRRETRRAVDEARRRRRGISERAPAGRERERRDHQRGRQRRAIDPRPAARERGTVALERDAGRPSGPGRRDAAHPLVLVDVLLDRVLAAEVRQIAGRGRVDLLPDLEPAPSHVESARGPERERGHGGEPEHEARDESDRECERADAVSPDEPAHAGDADDARGQERRQSERDAEREHDAGEDLAPRGEQRERPDLDDEQDGRHLPPLERLAHEEHADDERGGDRCAPDRGSDRPRGEGERAGEREDRDGEPDRRGGRRLEPGQRLHRDREQRRVDVLPAPRTPRLVGIGAVAQRARGRRVDGEIGPVGAHPAIGPGARAHAEPAEERGDQQRGNDEDGGRHAHGRVRRYPRRAPEATTAPRRRRRPRDRAGAT